ncbi:hypothetical protein K9B32_20550 [Rhizobium sp. 3T7]|uniref:hypothetical protein n=1 Tax=Rhizobium sp. 3T7 TaxID=2874922 RepID=UPI001CCD597D|nr:hypothetical protein [Rhizobium sp. 3T7]MBZ9792478.1 hypothetical protein [Rhizobium sp. 3T7]
MGGSSCSLRSSSGLARFSAWCTATHDSGYVLTIVENPVYFGAACDTADIVATPARLTECRSGALLFTGETLRRSGTAEIRIDVEHPS